MPKTLRKRQHVDYSRVGTDFTVDETDCKHLPKGWYYVGDLSYVICDDSDLDVMCDRVQPFNNEWMKIEREGKPTYYVFFVNTSNGVQRYLNESNKHESYLTYSDVVGCLYLDNLDEEERKKIIKQVAEPDEVDKYGHLHYFDTRVDFNGDDETGRLTFCGNTLCICSREPDEEVD
jgi:hypothetical protein